MSTITTAACLVVAPFAIMAIAFVAVSIWVLCKPIEPDISCERCGYRRFVKHGKQWKCERCGRVARTICELYIRNSRWDRQLNGMGC